MTGRSVTERRGMRIASVGFRRKGHDNICP
jgi:hypothetical protein